MRRDLGKERYTRTGLGSRYWKLWTATTISNIGDGVRFAALPLLAVTLTRDPVLVAGTVFAAQLPWLLLALISGALVHRLNRRLVMVAANLFRAVVIALLGLAVLGEIEGLVFVYVIVFLLGTAESLFDSAAFALLPALVDEAELERANGLAPRRSVAKATTSPDMASFFTSSLPTNSPSCSMGDNGIRLTNSDLKPST